MKKLILPFIGFIVCITILIYILTDMWSKATEQVNVHVEKVESYIGDTVVIQKDTLIILDYSLFDDTFILSNGVEVSQKLVFKQLENE